MPLIYTSAHQSLAALEILVHLQPRGSLEFVTFPLTIPDENIHQLAASELPQNWRAEPPGAATMRIGDEWARSRSSAALAVPSSVVPEEINYLLNPLHEDYRRIKIEAAHDFSFDPRLMA